ncbi:MAG TPA: CDP-alcohol phosphatidyltransferase family protein, partial [Polyangia bacterium]|nr:CDP-alcohol phosphatidyltransferase family protein [Polyangia bacterium]
MLAAVVDAYRRTKKPRDILWNRFVARPLAAVLLVPLARTSVTPNQVTFATLVVFVCGAAMLALCPGHGALIGAAAILEASYVLDCVDGQLARWKGMSSPVGAHLDFLMDEIKAFVLVAAVAVRLWRGTHAASWLVEGLLGLVAVATAISLTTFVRRPEYAAATGAAASHGAGDYGTGFDAAPAAPSRSPVALVMSFASFLAHYPSYILFVAIANRLDLFLHVYAGLHVLHAARSR